MDRFLFRSMETMADALLAEAPDAASSFDLIWCERAGCIMAYEKALRCCARAECRR